MNKNHVSFRKSKNRINTKLRLRLFLRDLVEVFWRWMFYLNLAILTKLTWNIFGLSNDEENTPVLTFLLLTTSILTLTVKAIDSIFKYEEKNDVPRTSLGGNHNLRSLRDRFWIARHLALKASRLRFRHPLK